MLQKENPNQMPPNTVSGSFHLLFLFDVCDEIPLEELRRILGLQPGGRLKYYDYGVVSVEYELAKC